MRRERTGTAAEPMRRRYRAKVASVKRETGGGMDTWRDLINMPILECAGKHGRAAGLCHHWGVILAGGDGKRLLPLTRRITGDERPKQFCCVIGRETLLHQTRIRVAGIVPPYQILVVLTKGHEPFYADQVDDLPAECLLIQPDNRGTAPAILYSLTRVRHLDSKGLVAFFPSDHHFSDEPALHAYVDSAFREAESHPQRVILLGISPDTPEADYGWIQPGAPLGGSSIFCVERFWEKPSQSLACALMSRGCLWNSFIMVGRVEAFLNLIQHALPALLRPFCAMTSRLAVEDQMALNDLYSGIPIVNFSQQVLSVCPAALGVLRADGLGWSDLGDPDRVLSVLARKGILLDRRMHFAKLLDDRCEKI
jgi:mannose-1-phosphate guanylyltransferase